DVQISAGEDRDELRAVAKWLRNEDELRGLLRLVNAPTRPGRMGGVLESVSLLVGSGGIGTVLIKSLFTYLGQRRRAITLELRLKREDGQELELKLSDPKSADAVLKQAVRFFGDHE